jgi:Xaa-Pro aminopeptidase
VSRLARLAAPLAEPLLVSNPVNVRYLTGLSSSNAYLLVDPDGCATVYADFRYAEAASQLAGVTYVETPRDVVGELATLLAGKRIGIEHTHLTVARWTALQSGGVDVVAAGGAVERLRAVKDEAELAAIRRAASVSDRVFAELAREQFTGRTDRELAWWVERRFREEGAHGLAFDPIVVAGLQGARPHASLGDHVIGPNTLVTVDAGCAVDGYRSDCTRTFATGEPPEDLAQAFALVAQAQLDGLAAVRPGARGSDVDAASRVAIENAGLGWAYGHGLGHGVGLDIHEAPALRPESEDVLEAGNVVTVEPGLYLPGIGGCRVEDLVVVTESGCERLTTVRKDLVVVS